MILRESAISELKLDIAVALILVTAGLSMAVDALSRTLRGALRIAVLPVAGEGRDAAAGGP